MPLVVPSLKGDASDVFDWTWSITPGGAQDLSTLLQMLCEHYCGSYTFREQRNMVENLCQGVCEDAMDFMIRVGTSISNLGKDWKDQLTEEKLESLQYEVSLNGVKEEIRHVLDTKIARHSWLTPHQMYEVVKKYETYVARNKCLEGKSASPHTNHQRAVATNSASIKPLPLQPQLKRLQILLLQSQDLLFLKMRTIQRQSQPEKMMKDCSSPVSWRRL